MSLPTADSSTRLAVVDRLISKSGVRSEATIQADVRMLLLDSELGLAHDDLEVQLEAPVGQGRRIDVEVGCTVIEVKKSLAGAALQAALTQLSGYVHARTVEKSQRYVGMLTDGRLWVAFHEVAGVLQEATRHTAVGGAAGATALLRWLEGVLATKQAVRPTPQEIVDRLGATSSSHALDHATLAALYAESRDLPTVALKRDLWASLLHSALGTQFTNTDKLFLEHTLLVNSAEIIAHLVVGLPAEKLSAATLLSGDQFSLKGLHGVVDRDFFDWVLEVPGGDGFVAALARRLARFDWSEVDHDVLKQLYESVIPADTRKVLGEYYTPDWLANRVVNEVVTDPLHQRVLDPSCGSGTFLFYAVRRYLMAAEASGVSLRDAMAVVSSRVIGIDLHPVAVALARVTYLLALGRRRLSAPDRGSLSVPVYLGDSLGWDLREDLLTVDHLVIPTEVGDQLVSGELRFAEHLLADSAAFDDLVQSLVDESGRAAHKPTSTLSAGTVRRLALDPADLPTLNANFARLKELHEAQRNHIWSYYIRNVSRPAWLARGENRADVLVGNPPWLSYRHMTAAMQQRFKALAQDRGFWHDESTATHQDLAGLFVARTVERYLKPGGRIAFVVPNSVLDRGYWTGFRSGRFAGANVAFHTSWDLRRIRPHLFPRGSAVVFATRSEHAVRMPTAALLWSGRAPRRDAALDTAQALHQAMGKVTVGGDEDTAPRSPYAVRFSQGANLVPRVFFRVEDAPPTPLGVPYGLMAVRSRRSVSEKPPWKTLPGLNGTVESEFVWRTLLGEQIVPFRVLDPDRFVLPLTRKGGLLAGDNPHLDRYPGLAAWIREAEELWAAHGQSKLTLIGQIDHMRKLTQQVPVPPIRVVYAASGMHVSASVVTDPQAIVEHGAYWASVATEAEGRYLAGILNSPVLTELVRPLMSYGKDERHVDKHVWRLAIPAYDADNDNHREIARLSQELAIQVAELTFPTTNFVTIRRQIRGHLVDSDTGQQLNQMVAALLDVETPPMAATAVPDGPRQLIRVTSGPLHVPAGDVELDVDCEFDLGGVVYLWGVLHTDTATGESTYQSFGSPDQDLDESANSLQFLSWATAVVSGAKAEGRRVVWYHYGHAERVQLRRLLGPAAEAFLEHGTDLLTEVIRPNFYAPMGYGLKSIGASLDATWRTAGASGADTTEWVGRARAGDAAAWQKLLDYNKDDTRATLTVRRALFEKNGSVRMRPTERESSQ